MIVNYWNCESNN